MEQPARVGTADLQGALEDARKRFLAAVKDMRPRLHRFCTRMCGSTLGGVKAALHRGRAKLRQLHRTRSPVELDRDQRKLLDEYLTCFNRRDWDALRRLIQSDARIEIVGVTETTVATYFSNYSALA